MTQKLLTRITVPEGLALFQFPRPLSPESYEHIKAVIYLQLKAIKDMVEHDNFVGPRVQK